MCNFVENWYGPCYFILSILYHNSHDFNLEKLPPFSSSGSESVSESIPHCIAIQNSTIINTIKKCFS